MLNAKLAATDSMTHDVIRDMLGVKMSMTTWAVRMPILLFRFMHLNQFSFVTCAYRILDSS
jgi:hypothetical protein